MDNSELEQRIAWLEASVRRIAGSVSPPVSLPDHPLADPGEISDEVRALVAAGKNMQAMQLHREQTGAGLAEAKDAIESVVAGN
jgi:ribosomal protein L7/L12